MREGKEEKQPLANHSSLIFGVRSGPWEHPVSPASDSKRGKAVRGFIFVYSLQSLLAFLSLHVLLIPLDCDTVAAPGGEAGHFELGRWDTISKQCGQGHITDGN